MRKSPLYEKVLPQGKLVVLGDRPKGALARIKQTHSSIVVPYKGEPLDDIEADGVVFKLAALQGHKAAVAITTADCLPILFLGKTEGAFVHAGWRGLWKNIHLAPEISAIRPNYAFIGPHIGQEAFEVGADFKERFKEEKYYTSQKGKLYFDLESKAIDDMTLKYPGIRIETSGDCTYKLKKYNSYRRDGTSLRNWNIFTL